MTVIGGYAELKVSDTTINKNNISPQYAVCDHFAAGESDAHSPLPGLPALYYLQHYVKDSKFGNTYMPFKWNVKINRDLKF